MVRLHGREYTEVKERIPLLFAKFPNAYIETEVYWHSENFDRVCMIAHVYPNTSADDKRVFTGIAYEERVESTSEVNFSAWVENCETSAIGRALANDDIGVAVPSPQGGITVSRPSAEEMDKVERMKHAAPAKKFPRTIQKAGAAQEAGEASSEFLKRVEAYRVDLKALYGHDQHFLQLMANFDGKVEPNAFVSAKQQQELLDSLSAFTTNSRGLIETRAAKKGATLKDLDDTARAEVEVTAKKLSLF